jgi:hypothetical protein
MIAGERVAAWLSAVRPRDIPDGAHDTAHALFLDVAGLCVAARRELYVGATLGAVRITTTPLKAGPYIRVPSSCRPSRQPASASSLVATGYSPASSVAPS